MNLSKVQPFLDEAFEFLREQEFSITMQTWKNFCSHEKINFETLQIVKLELLHQSQKLDDDSERLKKIFCCDPFDG